MALSEVQQVRLKIGDRDTADPSTPILTDDEIQHCIDQHPGDLDAAAGECALALAFYFSTLADQTTGRISVNYTNRAKVYRDLANDLGIIDDAGATIAPAFIGGISKSQNRVSEENDDRIQPEFKRDLHETDQETTGG